MVLRPSIAGTLLVPLLALGASFQTASATELIQNGGFESGLSGWTAASNTDPNGAYDTDAPIGGYVLGDASGVAPYSGLQTLPPPSGSSFALADSTASGNTALIQDFTVPLLTLSVSLSYSMYVYDWSGYGPQGSSLDAGSQIARVDLLRAGAADFSTDPLDVVATFYASAESDPNVAFAPHTFDLTGLALPGASYRLRFAVADSLFVLSQGIDDVSVQAATPVPEPASFAALGLMAAPLFRRRARHA